MCEFPRDRALKNKGPVPVTQSLLDESATAPIRPSCKFMVRPRERYHLGYHIYPVIEESESYYIVEDSPTLPDCIPMKQYGAKLLAFPKDKWERVPRYEWRDVTKESRFLVTHEGRSVRDGHTSEDFAVTITKRVELKD